MSPQDPQTDRALLFRELGREPVLRTPIGTVFRTTRSPMDTDSNRSDFYLFQARDWATVVPVLDLGGTDEAFLMVRQYRHGIDAITLEFPAGLVEEGEPVDAAARRELLEETGYQATAMAHVATMGAAPAFMTNHCHVFVAWGLAGTSPLALDPSERIQLVTVPARTVTRDMGTGELVNGVTATAHYFYLRWAGSLAGRVERTGKSGA